MNKLMVHFLLSNLDSQLTGALKKRFPNKDFGKLLSVSYLGEGDNIVQRVEMERYKGDTILDDKDKEMFSKIPGLNIKKELGSCQSIILKLDFVKREIKARYYYADGTEKERKF